MNTQRQKLGGTVAGGTLRLGHTHFATLKILRVLGGNAKILRILSNIYTKA